MAGTNLPPRVYIAQPIDDDDVEYFAGELVGASKSTTNSEMYGSVTTCCVCNDVEGHLPGCPIETLERAIALTEKRRKGRADAAKG